MRTEDVLELSPKAIDWICRAVRAVKYGEVVLMIHDGRITRIDTKDRKRVEG
jgi:hypothetical protein